MSATAGTMDAPSALPWHFYATLGYVNYEDMLDKNVAIERIAGARDLFNTHNVIFGLELGVQTGLDSRLLTAQENIDALGGTTIQAVISTFFDVLGTIRTPVPALPALKKNDFDFMKHADVFTKVGMAYRQMHFGSSAINPKVNINPEVQVGVTMFLTSHASISLAYQGIYAKGVGLRVNGTDPRSATAHVQSIPTQNGGLVIFGWNAA